MVEVQRKAKMEAILNELSSSIGADYCSLISPTRSIYILVDARGDFSRFSNSAEAIGSLLNELSVHDLQGRLEQIIIHLRVDKISQHGIVAVIPIEPGTYLLVYFPNIPHGHHHYLFTQKAIAELRSCLYSE